MRSMVNNPGVIYFFLVVWVKVYGNDWGENIPEYERTTDQKDYPADFSY